MMRSKTFSDYMILYNSVTTLNDLTLFISDPSFGISSLGKVNHTYENDQELMIQFYKFVAK